MSAHRQAATHWAPKAVEDSPYTACGRHIDGPCDQHEAEQQPCQYGLAWTRSTGLESYRHRPYESWPPPCPVCEADAAVEQARIAGLSR